jgi:hypothetical protein
MASTAPATVAPGALEASAAEGAAGPAGAVRWPAAGAALWTPARDAPESLERHPAALRDAVCIVSRARARGARPRLVRAMGRAYAGAAMPHEPGTMQLRPGGARGAPNGPGGRVTGGVGQTSPTRERPPFGDPGARKASHAPASPIAATPTASGRGSARVRGSAPGARAGARAALRMCAPRGRHTRARPAPAAAAGGAVRSGKPPDACGLRLRGAGGAGARRPGGVRGVGAHCASGCRVTGRGGGTGGGTGHQVAVLHPRRRARRVSTRRPGS